MLVVNEEPLVNMNVPGEPDVPFSKRICQGVISDTVPLTLQASTFA